MSKVEIFDRAVFIYGEDQVKSFLADPHGFLKSAGALEGLPDYRGSFWLDGSPVSPEDFERFDRAEGEVVLRCHHHGIPWKEPCTWHCIER